MHMYVKVGEDVTSCQMIILDREERLFVMIDRRLGGVGLLYIYRLE